MSATDYNVKFTQAQTGITVTTSTISGDAEWLQPIQATTYSGLRRYSKGEKVKGYYIGIASAAVCVSTTCLLTAGADGAVDLLGAVSLATGAAAVAVASLAF